MKTFAQFRNQKLTEGTPTGWKPEGQLGDNVVWSALEKIQRAAMGGQAPFNGSFSGSEVIMQRLGLNRPELDILQKHKIVRQDGASFSVDQNRFANVFQQIRGMSPNMVYRPQQQATGLQPPPPPPSPKQKSGYTPTAGI